MENRYTVSEIFRKAFGINIPFYITEDFRRNAPQNLSFDGIETLPDYYEPTATTWMGTPVLFGATFKGGIYQRYNLRGEIVDVELPDLVLPPATMFQFRRAKNITRTNILGSNGTVKEIFGFDDWIIDVRGFCLDEPNRSAQSQLKDRSEERRVGKECRWRWSRCQAEDGIRDADVTGVQTCALPIYPIWYCLRLRCFSLEELKILQEQTYWEVMEQLKRYLGLTIGLLMFVGFVWMSQTEAHKVN